MAMPSVQSVQKRYTASSCTLEIDWQLSALSQWYPKPVAQDLRFKLWVNSDQGDASATSSAANSVLVAEGDRATLQAISQYISQQVCEILAVATPLAKRMAPLIGRDRSATLQVTPRPPSLQLTQPLSYLLLCDLNSVLHQCEQATSTLPVALSPSLLPSLSDAPSTPKASNVIPFDALRRSIRQQPAAWASSAAAALLAVGLTTTLWPSYQTSSEPSATADQEPGFSQTGRTRPEPNSDLSATDPDADTVAKPNLDINPAPLNNASPSTSENSIRPSKLETKQPNTSTAATAGQSQSAAGSPATSPAEPAAKVPPAASETTVSPPIPPESNNALSQTPQNEPESFDTERANTPALSSALEAAPPPPSATESARQRDPGRASERAPEADTATSSSTADPAMLSLEPTAIAQIQRYFQAKWQESGIELSEPLSYNIQLSATGEVVSFTALSGAAETYRDRLLPNDRPLRFSFKRTTESATAQNGDGFALLRLNILPSGQVQVFRR